jgi:hypothetical protein
LARVEHSRGRPRAPCWSTAQPIRERFRRRSGALNSPISIRTASAPLRNWAQRVCKTPKEFRPGVRISATNGCSRHSRVTVRLHRRGRRKSCGRLGRPVSRRRSRKKSSLGSLPWRYEKVDVRRCKRRSKNASVCRSKNPSLKPLEGRLGSGRNEKRGGQSRFRIVHGTHPFVDVIVSCQIGAIQQRRPRNRYPEIQPGIVANSSTSLNLR